ncbi:FAD-dependent oxidoreductase [Streptomyces wedmorensis]|uniref:FAD-dependent oxidoreductase n=1 Tax=Streptomyces wedmorensis TaxID=43759 RepID=UPI00379263D1
MSGPMAVSGRERSDVIVVGAGAAGLACAADLAACGVAVRLLEADESPDARTGTDQVAGFTVDRGSQVSNTSYPQVKRRLDLRRPRLRRFSPTVLVSTVGGIRRFTDPTRDLRRSGDLLTGRAASPRDLLAVGVLSARDMLEPAALLRSRSDTTTHIAFRGTAGPWCRPPCSESSPPNGTGNFERLSPRRTGRTRVAGKPSIRSRRPTHCRPCRRRIH